MTSPAPDLEQPGRLRRAGRRIRNVHRPPAAVVLSIVVVAMLAGAVAWMVNDVSSSARKSAAGANASAASANRLASATETQAGAIEDLTASNRDLSKAIGRRSAVLDYLAAADKADRCRAALERARDLAVADVITNAVAGDDPATLEASARLDRASSAVADVDARCPTPEVPPQN